MPLIVQTPARAPDALWSAVFQPEGGDMAHGLFVVCDGSGRNVAQEVRALIQGQAGPVHFQTVGPVIPELTPQQSAALRWSMATDPQTMVEA